MKNQSLEELYEKHGHQKNNFPIAFYSLTKNTQLLAHWHEHIEILFFKSGTCRFTCSDKEFIASKGDFIYVNSKEIHSHYSPLSTDYICLLLYPEFFADVEFQNIRIQNFIKSDETICNLMEEIEKEYREKDAGNDMRVKGLIYILMSYLMRNYADNESGNRTVNLKLFSKAENYISNHYNEKITRSDIAKLCFVSNSYISKYFKSVTGRTVSEYINEYKIKKAMFLLQNRDLSISEVALSIGFDDLNYFSRIFKKITSMTPSEYKKNQPHKDLLTDSSIYL